MSQFSLVLFTNVLLNSLTVSNPRYCFFIMSVCLSAMSVCSSNSVPNDEYSNLLVVTTFSRRSFTGKTSSPV